MPFPSQTELAALVAFDTPTICNALEVVVPESRPRGFTVRPLICGFPDLPPMIGYARTATIRARDPCPRSTADARERRDDYYLYVNGGRTPSLIVIEDIDRVDAGYGAFWGQVQSAIHQGMGA